MENAVPRTRRFEVLVLLEFEVIVGISGSVSRLLRFPVRARFLFLVHSS